MKKFAWTLLLLPVLACAGPREDYARQWPLQTADAQAGAFRVALDESVYRELQTWEVRDLDIVDAQGKPVPSALIGADAPVQAEPAWESLPWFALPPLEQAHDVAAISEIATDGSLRRVEWRAGSPPNALSGFLIDASHISRPLHALRLQWQGNAPLEISLRLEVSDNLRDWQLLDADARLVDLQNQGRRVLQDRLEFAAERGRYLRLTPRAPLPADFRITGVQGQSSGGASLPAWHWQTLTGRAVTDDQGQRHYEFDLPGRFPIERADAVLSGNSSQEWQLQSRDSQEQPWRVVAGPWVAFALQSADGQSASPPQPVAGPNRSHHWRLTPLRGVGEEVPQLKLGWRPEVVVFVAQGQAPFSLLAGSARAQRSAAPVLPMMTAMREQRGAGWQPAIATLGASTVQAGEAALQPAPTPRDWKAWLLWSLLIGGAVLVTALAFSLLRKPSARD